MRWIKGNHPEKTKVALSVGEGRKALVRMQYGMNPPVYKTDYWIGTGWISGDAGATKITHYVWIAEPKNAKCWRIKR